MTNIITDALTKAADDGDAAKVEQKPRSRISRYDQYFNVREGRVVLVKSLKPDVKKHGRKVLAVVRRITDEKGFLTKTEVDIKSDVLARVMEEINADVEGISLRTKPPVVPLEMFYHTMAALQSKLDHARQNSPVDSDLIDDLTEITKFAEEEFATTSANLKRLTEAGECTFELLWAIFTPNTLVYRHHEYVEEDQILKFRSMRIVTMVDKSRYWKIDCHIVANDGNKFGLAYEPFLMYIDEFVGARAIKDLNIFPLKYHPDAAKLRADALRRGRQFASLFEKPVVVETDGPAMFEKRDVRHIPRQYKFFSRGRMIVDPKGFRASNPNIAFIPTVHMKLDPDGLSEEQLVICPPIALGFCFSNRKWGGFPVSRLSPVNWNSDAFRDLVMDSRTKTFFHSMVKQHSSEDDDFDDIIAGKGKGIVCLFSGPPGSGKTLTAEAVAEITRRPLYSVSAGDLGVVPDAVDEKLSKILEQSHRWNAVLLLDEADVFLEQRQPKDVTRNALVSIFLRQLEYYQGILIMTTNRIGQIDTAFRSRIHVSISYPELDEKARRHIWSMFIRRYREATQKGGGGYASDLVSEEAISRLAREKVNGRQIKNTFNCARIFAKELGEPLSMGHIDQVLGINNWGSDPEEVVVNGVKDN
ncbi:P-loop containing nucleoside triphosphate hydrolase protein [Apodospora peruviana]|uniref:P-loop containing nucleoside triphosphate hydrolase protein n=1 Tax=Apodospora peruviana TaxID=516989 RepID=A0AAE0LXX7_9PEZI|nr:P-loop containing nucleoside triphosphate hydrolase protein [Apodospora peruviana]